MRKIILVEPEIPENTGSIARLAANFDCSLRIVNPGFNLEEARKTAKNAQDKLREAEIVESVEEAVEDLEFVVGTKPGKGISASDFTPRENTSVMIGRESSGLSNEELDRCDTVVHIDVPGYESLNQSHATAVVLSHLHDGEKKGIETGQKQKLRESVSDDFLSDIILRASPSVKEAGRLIGILEDMKDS